MTSVIVSAITVYKYQSAVHTVLVAHIHFLAVWEDWDWNWENPYFASKDTALELTDHGNTAVAISSLVVICSIIEVALAVCAAWISDSLFQPLQENQISQVCEGIYTSFEDTRNNYHIIS